MHRRFKNQKSGLKIETWREYQAKQKRSAKANRLFYSFRKLAIIILIVGFTLGNSYGMAPPMIALVVAAFFLILSHDRANEFLMEVGWDTVFFLVGLFGLVVGLGIVGLIDDLAD